MNKTLLAFAALVVATVASAPASANGLDPRMLGLVIGPMMHVMHPQYRGCNPRFQRCYRPPIGYAPQGAPHPCGSAYVPNRYGGTVVTGLPDCGRYGWQHGYNGAYWGPNGYGAPGYGGMVGGYGSGYAAGHSHTRIVRMHSEHFRQVTVHGQRQAEVHDNLPDNWHVIGR